jgi:hypothetical protein
MYKNNEIPFEKQIMCNVSFHPQAFLTQIRADKIFSE